MTRVASILVSASGWIALPAQVNGHVGDRVFPIFEITETMLMKIDLRDGSIDDWVALVGEPTITPLDFTARESHEASQYDPNDLDFRIWLGWSGDFDRLYVGAVFADDRYANRFEGPETDYFENTIAWCCY